MTKKLAREAGVMGTNNDEWQRHNAAENAEPVEKKPEKENIKKNNKIDEQWQEQYSSGGYPL